MKWSFAIPYLTGTFLPIVIKSILNQNNLKRNDVEIVIIGPNVKILDTVSSLVDKTIIFEESLVPSWITMKKNLAIQNCKYDNVCIMHDYVGLCENWYNGYLQFGDDWDICMNPVRMQNSMRYRDWITLERPIKFISYEDTTQIKTNMYVSGTYWCAKKKFMLDNPLNVGYVWGQGEDIEWSLRCRKNWNYKLNLNSIVKLLKEKPEDDWVPHPTLDMNTSDTYNTYQVQT
jgi:hypothetical protein